MSRKPTRRSAFWVVADLGTNTIFSILGILIIARLVGPQQFGAAAVAVGLIQVVNLYVGGLLHDALIRDRTISDDAFDQGFWLTAAIGVSVAGLAGCAALVLHGTEAETLALLVFAASLSLPFSGMIGICNARLRRGMDYRFVAVPSVASKLFAVVIGIGTAMAGAGGGSLVFQLVGGAIAQAIGLLLISRWKPRVSLSISALRPLWRFALPYAVMHSLVGLRIQGFVSLVAVFGGYAAAGYVNVAFRLTLTPQIMLTTSLSDVGLPLMALEVHDRQALKKAFLRFEKWTALAFPIVFFGLAACSHLVVRVVLGPTWLPSAPAMAVFAICSGLYLLRIPSSLLLRVLGHVRYSLLNSIMHLVITLGGLILLQPTSLLQTSLLWFAPLVPLMPLTIIAIRREAGFPALMQLRALLAPLGFVAGTLGIVFLVQIATNQLPAAEALAAPISAGGITYLTLLLLFDSEARGLVVGQLRAAARRSGLAR